ncbi:AN1-type zinc finger protein 4-like isoform X3 [Galleria mellonella]|uniref:AN1-type zinc finger protein 4-like isoform X3 n=1 Tax=Galleria mellonella TaxID=7137 RepID=A0ABM3MIH5_GALME|nr:AN1-type zinc finger protein 4-like isoform X3 [Galleria mellonella]
MSQHGCPERLSNRAKGFEDEGPSQPTMEVLVETLTGTAFEMTVSPSDTIFAIKSKIFRVEGIPVSQQHILYNLKELDDSSSLREHAISDGARLRLVLGMRGGPISSRRLPPPPNAEPWRDIERLLDSNSREESEWSSGSGCKVTVLVFREGGRVNLLRVRENHDGTYSPLDNKYSSSLTLVEQELDDGLPGSLHENEVTMGKMLDLRRRMENLSIQRRRTDRTGNKPEIQKTRSEETLSVPSLLDEATVEPFKNRTYTPYEEESFAPMYDGNYTRYDYDCSFADRYTLLPPIGTRTDSDQSVQEVGGRERVQVSQPLAGAVLVPPRRRPPLATLPAADYGPLVGGEAGGWRAAGFGSSSQLAPHSHSASSLHALQPLQPLHPLQSLQTLHPLHPLHPLRAAPAPRHHPPLSDALFSSSTSDLEKLKRNRILPTLSRHRNREHLHLSDEGLHLAAPPAPPAPRSREVGSERRQRRIHNIAEQPAQPTRPTQPTQPPQPPQPGTRGKPRVRCGVCRRRLGAATEHRCRCGAAYCAPHRYAEVHGCAYDYKAPPPDLPDI